MSARRIQVSSSVGDLVESVTSDLRKTPKQCLSSMMYLSGDFLWATHTTCQRSRVATED